MKPFERKDRFYQKAKKEGYPARSAYKIMELDDQYHIFKTGNRVIDLGAAPGGWFKVGIERLGSRGKMVGIDLLPLVFTPSGHHSFFKGDFTDPINQTWIREQCGQPADWVISDMAPNTSGIKFSDSCASFELCEAALAFAVTVLRSGGGFVCKLFPGQECEALKKKMKQHFVKVDTVIPEATRQSSREIYLIAKGKKY